MRDDSWRDSYDEWKLRSPYDERDEECIHLDYETDVEGRATCCTCGERWWLTPAEIQSEREMSAAYDAMVRREERREWIAAWVSRLAFWRRWRKPKLIDDELPF